MSLAKWDSKRIAEELERGGTGWCDTQAHEIARSALLALKEAREEIARLHEEIDRAVAQQPGRDARMKKIGAAEELEETAKRPWRSVTVYPADSFAARKAGVVLCERLIERAAQLRREADIEAAREHTITPAEHDAQVRSFAYGNVRLANPEITREEVDQAVDTLRREGGE